MSKQVLNLSALDATEEDGRRLAEEGIRLGYLEPDGKTLTAAGKAKAEENARLEREHQEDEARRQRFRPSTNGNLALVREFNLNTWGERVADLLKERSSISDRAKQDKARNAAIDWDLGEALFNGRKLCDDKAQCEAAGIPTDLNPEIRFNRWLGLMDNSPGALNPKTRQRLMLAWEHFGHWLEQSAHARTSLKETARLQLMRAWRHFGHRRDIAARFNKTALYVLAEKQHDKVREKVIKLLDTVAVDAKGKPKSVTGPLLNDLLAKAQGKPTKAEVAKKAAETRKAKGEFKHSQVTALLSIPPSELTREEINALAQHLAAATA